MTMAFFTTPVLTFAAAVLLTAGPALSARSQHAPEWAAKALRAVNELRLQQGLEELEWAPDLQDIAQSHSDEMAARGQLSHDGFQSRFDRTVSRMCVENVAGGSNNPAVLAAVWSRAPAHQRNLYDPRVRRAGLAENRGFVTFFACE